MGLFERKNHFLFEWIRSDVIYYIFVILLTLILFGAGAGIAYSIGGVAVDDFWATPDWQLFLVFFPMHYFVLRMMMNKFRGNLTGIRRTIDISDEEFEREVGLITNNIVPILFGVILGGLDIWYAWVADTEYVAYYTQIYPRLVFLLSISWVLEWFITGCMVWFMVAYCIVIWRLVKKWGFTRSFLDLYLTEELEELKETPTEIAPFVFIYLILWAFYWFYAQLWDHDAVGYFAVTIMLFVVFLVPNQFIVERGIKEERREKTIQIADSANIGKNAEMLMADPTKGEAKDLLVLLVLSRYLEEIRSMKGAKTSSILKILIAAGVPLAKFAVSYFGYDYIVATLGFPI